MTEPTNSGPPPPAPDARDSKGRHVRTLEQAERDAWAAGQRPRPYRDIAADLGISVSSCHEAVRRAYKDIAEPAAGPARAAELAVLEAARDAALEVMARRHVTVSNGKVIYLNGAADPLEDDGPILQAAATVARISTTIHDLMGWKAPAKVQVSGDVTYQLIGISTEDLT
jgi:DNA-binding Lrp family transcriptional regulator